MPEIQLMGGEQDGHTVTIPSISDCPEIFYAVPLADLEKIRATEGTTQRLAIREKLATLAYRFDRIHVTGDDATLRYSRAPERDK